MPPDPYSLFAYYHLGFDDEYNYRFRNLHATARHFGAEPPQVLAWLEQYGMDPDTVRRVDFNLSQAHADAQQLDLDGASVEAREQFVRATYERFVTQRNTTKRSTPYEDVDWDDPLGLGR